MLAPMVQPPDRRYASDRDQDGGWAGGISRRRSSSSEYIRVGAEGTEIDLARSIDRLDGLGHEVGLLDCVGDYPKATDPRLDGPIDYSIGGVCVRSNHQKDRNITGFKKAPEKRLAQMGASLHGPIE